MPNPPPPMVFHLAPNPQVPTTAANRSIVHVAEDMVFLEFGLIEPSEIVTWHRVINSNKPPAHLHAQHKARIVMNVVAMMTLRQQLNDIAKQMGVDQQPPPTMPPASTGSN